MFAVELEKQDAPAWMLEWHGLAPDRDSALRCASSAWEDRYGEPVSGCRAVIREISGD
jgi:hypothetical protein